jgi:hypothetical protein
MLYIFSMVNIPCVLVEGHVKGLDYVPGAPCEPANHVWNGVYLKGKWRLVDCSWAAGHVTRNSKKFKYLLDDHYFCTDPEKFILDHFPLDTRWQLLPVSLSPDCYHDNPCIHSGYFRLGIRDCSVTSGQMNVKDTAHVVLHLTRAILVTYDLWEIDSERYCNECVKLETSDDRVNLSFQFPKSGKFILVIHGATYDVDVDPTRIISVTFLSHVTAPLRTKLPCNKGAPWGPTSAFCQLGIRPVGDTTFFHKVIGSDCELEFCSQGTILSAVCSPVIAHQDRVLCNKINDVTKICVRPSESGYLRVAVFARSVTGHAEQKVCTVLLCCHALLEPRPSFPHTTTRWLSEQCALHRPTESPLKRHARVTFHLQVPQAVVVVIVQGRTLAKLTQTDPVTWRGQIRTSGCSGILHVSAMFGSSRKFYKLLQYDLA